MKFLLTVRTKLNSMLTILEKVDFKPSTGWGEFFQKSWWWSGSTFFGVLVIDWLGKFRATEYLNKAITQGVSPELWNVIGAVGLFFLGLSIVTVKTDFPHRWLSKASSRILLIASEIGLFAFGISLGQLLGAFSKAQLLAWQAWFWGISIGILLTLLLVTNFLLWYLARVSHYENCKAPLMSKLACWSLPEDIIVGATVAGLPIWFLLLKR
jgi:hypothetical protein